VDESSLAGRGMNAIALEETASTNAHALELLRSGAAPPHLTLVWARRQTNGRGRGGRIWQSPEGNVFFSMILRPQPDWGDLNQLPLVTSVATHAAIRAHVPPSRVVTIKWPNDVLVDGAKVSGTLIESHLLTRSTEVRRWSAEALVIGIGVNVANAPTQGLLYPATSLFESIRAAYLESAHGMGERITVRTSLDQKESASGTFEGIDEDGALLLRLDDGTVRPLVVGDVFFGDPDKRKGDTMTIRVGRWLGPNGGGLEIVSIGQDARFTGRYQTKVGKPDPNAWLRRQRDD